MTTTTPEQRAMRYNGYHRRSAGREDPELTHVGPGTPCGEYFRRFWLPVCMTEQVCQRPTVVKVLGEELVAFEDLSGRYGLVHKHCSHRRASNHDDRACNARSASESAKSCGTP